ncbi:MAG: hypothetical protein L6R30_07195 [Thermoanaerobaculia bacterium]|nr:hypothetical protein [Thermoanaerobaculia bacterium]MCK6682191.1 hypothetical protein [Thermoanaerobaculia bacterium]
MKTWEIFVRPIDGAGMIQVTNAKGWSPSWSADGRRLFWGWGHQLAYAELDAAGGLIVTARNTVTSLPFEATPCDLVPGGETFVCLAPDRTGSEVLVVAHWTHEVRRLLRRVASTEAAR